jgi:hypothetical protein
MAARMPSRWRLRGAGGLDEWFELAARGPVQPGVQVRWGADRVQQPLITLVRLALLGDGEAGVALGVLHCAGVQVDQLVAALDERLGAERQQHRQAPRRGEPGESRS